MHGGTDWSVHRSPSPLGSLASSEGPQRASGPRTAAGLRWRGGRRGPTTAGAALGVRGPPPAARPRQRMDAATCPVRPSGFRAPPRDVMADARQRRHARRPQEAPTGGAPSHLLRPPRSGSPWRGAASNRGMERRRESRSECWPRPSDEPMFTGLTRCSCTVCSASHIERRYWRPRNSLRPETRREHETEVHCRSPGRRWRHSHWPPARRRARRTRPARVPATGASPPPAASTPRPRRSRSALIAPLTGPIAPLTGPAVAGMTAFWDGQNARGGLARLAG